MQSYQTYRTFAEQLVRSGGVVAKKAFHSRQFQTRWKSDNTYVTQTDTAIEQQYRDQIAQAYPDHQVFGEELGGSIDSSKPTWILDPLDGTTNFSHQIPLYCSMAALQIENEIVCAAVYAPETDSLFSAALGAGATLNGEPMPPPSSETDLHKSTLLLDSGKSAAARSDSFALVHTSGATFRSFRKFGCMIVPLLFAAQGKLDVAIIFGVDLYDVAGLSLIFDEAGYTVLGRAGKAWQKAENTDFTLTTPLLKKSVQSLLQLGTSEGAT